MAKEIARLFITIGVDDKEYKQKLKQLDKSMNAVAKTAAVAGAAIVAGFALSVKKFAENAEQIEIMSQKTGLSTEAVQRYGHAAEMTGSSLDELGTGLRKMQVLITDAAEGTTAAVKTLNNLGVSIDELKGKSPDEQFQALAAAIAGIKDPTARAAAAVDVFGRSGTDMLPMLDKGVEGMKELTDAAVVMSDAQVEAGARLDDAIDQMKANLEGVVNTIGAAVAPAFENLTNMVAAAAKGFNDFAQAHPGIVGALSNLTLNFGLVSLAVGSLILGIPKLIKLIQTMTTTIKLTAGALGLLVLGITAVITAISLWVSSSQEQEAVDQRAIRYTQEREKAMQGLENAYEEATAAAIADLEQLAKISFLNDEQRDTILKKIKAMQDELDIWKQLTEAKEKDAEATRELTDRLNKMVDRSRYANTAASELGVTIQDISDYLADAGRETEIFGLNWEIIGEDANEMARQLGLNIEEVAGKTRDLKDETQTLSDSIQEMIDRFNYEQSAAYKLGISVQDVVGALHDAGVGSGWLADVLGSLGERADDVNAILARFNVTAEDISNYLEGLLLPADLMSKATGLKPFEIGNPLAAYMPDFDLGGTVPGTIGAPVLATVHGGEVITSPGKASITNNFVINGLVVREQADVERIARELYRMQQRNI